MMICTSDLRVGFEKDAQDQTGAKRIFGSRALAHLVYVDKNIVKQVVKEY